MVLDTDTSGLIAVQVDSIFLKRETKLFCLFRCSTSALSSHRGMLLYEQMTLASHRGMVLYEQMT